jgi:hypothetical protein
VDARFIQLGLSHADEADSLWVNLSEVKSIELGKPDPVPPPERLETEEREFDMSIYAADGQRVGEKKTAKFRVRADSPKVPIRQH